jgi:hypothetical protein
MMLHRLPYQQAIRYQSTIPDSLASIVSKGFDNIKRRQNSSHRQKTKSKKDIPHDPTPQDLLQPKRHKYDFHRPKSHDLEFDKIKPSKTIYNGIIRPSQVDYEPIEVPNQDPIPKLKHKLSRVLFSPGIHYLQDPRTGVFNFNPFLQNILPVDQFDFAAITTFVTASKDQILTKLAKEHKLKYYASTSSMTGVLSHFHFLLSNYRPVSLLNFSRQHPESYGHMTQGSKLPASVILRKRDGCYAIDSDKSSDREITLSLLGHSLERFLTKTPEEYEQYKKQPDRTKKIQEENTYHYAKLGPFLMRSQLDCYDSRLPGTGSFDLKTRAVAAVRHDLAYAEKNLTSYSIVKTHGRFESYERELLELSRSTMLKYSLQARIGDMDGIFLAYHNISKMFGFQYLPLSQMDEILHSFGLPSIDYMKMAEKSPKVWNQGDMVEQLSSKMADEDFKLSMALWSELLSKITEHIPQDSFRLVMTSQPISPFETKLQVVATTISEEEIEKLQGVGDRLQRLLIGADQQEHSDILDYHIKEIKKLNRQIRHKPVGFDIYVKSYMNETPIIDRHPVFKSLDDSWGIGVKFVQLTNEQNISVYDSCLAQKMNMLHNQSVIRSDEDASSLMKVLRLLGQNRNTKPETKEVIWNDE